MQDVLDTWKNPLVYAIPFFLLFILIELAALKWLDHDDNSSVGFTGYEGKDARTSLWMGFFSIFSTMILKIAAFFVYIVLYIYVAPFHLPTNTWWSWVLMIIAVDFCYYWQHRFVHRARVGWAAHQAHHSSEYMNFATALRQKWNPWFDFFFWLPLPILGITPWAIYSAYSINLIYQFFVHTETIRKLPRPIEFVFNTPSHHRVHHGSDELYLDRNYGGILIIWDRMFRTFQPEVFRPKYGLTHPVETYNLIKLQYGDYADLWRDVRGADSWGDRFRYLFKPPGWSPDSGAAGGAPKASGPRLP